MEASYDVNDVATQPSKLRTQGSTRATKLRRRHGRPRELTSKMPSGVFQKMVALVQRDRW
jgi:hypothetical protein